MNIREESPKNKHMDHLSTRVRLFMFIDCFTLVKVTPSMNFILKGKKKRRSFLNSKNNNEGYKSIK